MSSPDDRLAMLLQAHRPSDKDLNWRYHESWNKQFKAEWAEFQTLEPASGYSQQQILVFMNDIIIRYPPEGMAGN
jgi:hypothetical protein